MTSVTVEQASGAARRPPGRPRKLPLAEREQLVLDAAVVAFASRGSTAVSVDAIASRAGVNKAHIYEHFTSKQDLFVAAVRRERDRLVAFIAAQYSEGRDDAVRERIRARYHAFVDYTAEHPDGARLLALPEAAVALDGSGRDALSATLAGQLRQELSQAGLPANELPHILAAMFIGMAGGVIRRATAASWDPEALVDLLTAFTMAGLTGTDRDVLERADRST